MRLIIVNILILLSFGIYAQNGSNYNVELGLVQNHQRFLKLYNGVIDVGGGYNQKITGNLYAGIALNLSFLNRSGTSSRAVSYKPVFNIHYYFNFSERIALVPVVNIGYSFLSLSNKEYEYKETQSGLISGGTLRLHWKTKQLLDYYIFGRFDYIYLNKDETFTKLEYYRSVYLTSFGIGVRIKSGGDEK